MSDCPIEATDEGGDPACWAHLFDDADDAIESDEGQPPGLADQAASGPVSLRATTRS
jgi:hypothetical protein